MRVRMRVRMSENGTKGEGECEVRMRLGMSEDKAKDE